MYGGGERGKWKTRKGKGESEEEWEEEEEDEKEDKEFSSVRIDLIHKISSLIHIN